MDRRSMAGCFCHNGFIIIILAPAQNRNQFLRRQILFLQPVKEKIRQSFLYRSCIEDGSSLILQQGKIVFQGIDMLLQFQTPTVLRDTLPLKVDGHRFRAGFHRNLSAAISRENRVVIGVKTDGTESVHSTNRTLARVKGITGKRIQMDLFLCKHCTNSGFFTPDLVGQIAAALVPQHSVQLFHAACSGNRHANIASDITYQTFYKAFFISGGRIAEYCFKVIVGCQSGIPGLFPCMGTEAIFN